MRSRGDIAGWKPRYGLAKAQSDLATARILITGNERYLDTGSYHCQQAAEKALNWGWRVGSPATGWLTAQRVEFRKTHDVIELLEECSQLQASFETLRESAHFLLPFAVQFRYPGDLFEPPIEEALLALDHASKIVATVVASITNNTPLRRTS